MDSMVTRRCRASARAQDFTQPQTGAAVAIAALRVKPFERSARADLLVDRLRRRPCQLGGQQSIRSPIVARSTDTARPPVILSLTFPSLFAFHSIPLPLVPSPVSAWVGGTVDHEPAML
jgi:hypothetical protein